MQKKDKKGKKKKRQKDKKKKETKNKTYISQNFARGRLFAFSLKSRRSRRRGYVDNLFFVLVVVVYFEFLLQDPRCLVAVTLIITLEDVIVVIFVVIIVLTCGRGRSDIAVVIGTINILNFGTLLSAFVSFVIIITVKF
jgi:hypothetical protein